MCALHQEDTVDEVTEADPLEVLAAKHFASGPPRVRVQFGALTHPGKVRPKQLLERGWLRLCCVIVRDPQFNNLGNGQLNGSRSTATIFMLGARPSVGL